MCPASVQVQVQVLQLCLQATDTLRNLRAARQRVTEGRIEGTARKKT